MNATSRAAAGCLSAVSGRKAARRAAGLRRYESELRLHRGKCRAKGCRSVWGVTRVSIDLAMSRERVDRLATVECVQCHRTWYRIAAPEVTRAGYQAVLLTLIVPTGDKRVVFASHGGFHSNDADETLVIPDASLAQLDEAYRAWRKRHDQLVGARDRAKLRRAEKEAEATRAGQAALARMDERRAAREAEESEAEDAALAREKAGLA